MINVSTVAQDIITSFKTEELEIVKGYKFNQYNNVIRINLYLNQRFLECSNQDAIFWDLSTPRLTHFSKNIDLDTKDLYPYGIGETNFVQSWILRARLRKWLRESNMSELLDDMTDGVSAFGSCVWKICKKDDEVELEEVDLRNLYFNQTAKHIEDVPVVEMHYLTPGEIRSKDDAWDNVSEVLADKPGKNGAYEIWEYTGEYDKDGKTIWVKQIGYNFGTEAIILYTEEWTDEEEFEKDFQYRDFHIGKYRGRWQRIGIVERLYKLQERANTLVNQNAQATEIASLLLLRSSDLGTGVNVLEQAQNGQIISSIDLQQVGIDNRAFNVLLEELQKIEMQADKLCLTPDIVAGEALPSGTPFRSLAVLANAAKSAFKTTRDRIGKPIEDLLLNIVLPEEVKKWNREDLLEIAESDVDVTIYDDAVKNQMALETMLNGTLVTDEVMSQIGSTVDESMGKIGRKIKLPKNFFNFDYGIRFNITGESYDKQQQNDAYFNALQMVQQNPAINNIPLFKQYCENNGISWWRLTSKEQEQMMQQAQAQASGQMGGQIAKPQQDALMAQVNSG